MQENLDDPTRNAGLSDRQMGQRLTRLATAVPAVEAAVFGVDAAGQPRPIGHIRPGYADEEEKAQAVMTLGVLAEPCIENEKDGVMAVDAREADDREGGTRFCLIRLIYHRDRLVGAATVVSLCHNEHHARERLDVLRAVV